MNELLKTNNSNQEILCQIEDMIEKKIEKDLNHHFSKMKNDLKDHIEDNLWRKRLSNLSYDQFTGLLIVGSTFFGYCFLLGLLILEKKSKG